MDDDTGGLDDEEEVIIHVPVEMQAGVWANWAVLSESDHAFGESPTSPNALAAHSSVDPLLRPVLGWGYSWAKR